MVYKHHQATYHLGDGALRPDQRIVVGTRTGPKEARRVATHLGLSPLHPELIIDHTVWNDGEYLPRFNSRASLSRPDFIRYRSNYATEDGKRIWGHGLKGKVVYIVHTFSNSLTPQDLDKRVEFIADTAKYNGAEAVVLIAYTLDHSAQERGVHQTEHPRMQTDEAKFKFDGQSPISLLQLKQYASAGVDLVITPHNHCPDDTQRLCEEVNAEFDPVHQRSLELNSTQRYHLDFVHVDLSPMLGLFLSDYGYTNLKFDLSDSGKNVLFLCVDSGVYESGFVHNIRQYSGLKNAALAAMKKTRASDGSNIDMIELVHTEGLSTDRGIEGMHIFAPDDAIRSGETIRKNIEVFRGGSLEGLVRDPRIKGIPQRVAVYATRTNFAGNSVRILSSPAIDDVVITNSDPRGMRNLGEIDTKTQMLWINFMMAEAAMAVERGENPNDLLTPNYIRSKRLLRVDIPHGHHSLVDALSSHSGII